MPGSVKGGYDLSFGIQEVMTYEPLRLPERADVAPADSSSLRSLDKIYSAGNCEARIDAFLRPSVRNLENLSPGSHRRVLRQMEAALNGTNDAAAEKMRQLLSRDQANIRLLESFQGLLISG